MTRFVNRLACLSLLLIFHGRAAAQASAMDNSVILSSADFQPESDSTVVSADSTSSYLIRNIIITGNKKTNPTIILREINFQINEFYSVEQITNNFRKARKQLMNTGLFSEVIVSLKSLAGREAAVHIEVTERWYIWPQPFLKPVDKTFHEWWNEQDRDMDRINYGIRLVHNNFTGRNDKLKVNIMNGYTRQLSLQYYGLYLDNKLKWSLNAGVTMGRNREVNYMTKENKLVPIKDNDAFLRNYYGWFGEVTYRPAIKTRHTFGISYTYEDMADTIFKLNPDFSTSHQTIKYPELMYRLSYADVDFIPYPTKGFLGEVTLRKKGLHKDPINLWQLSAKGSKSWPLTSKSYFNLRAVGMVKLPFRQPYVTRQFIGYEDQYLQGYEYYVIDGVAGGYAKATFARQILTTNLRISQKIKRLNSVPLRIYAKTFVNTGYVYGTNEAENNLDNKLLYSGGVGIDVVTFTDFVIKIEWSYNRLGENGLYLHRRGNF